MKGNKTWGGDLRQDLIPFKTGKFQTEDINLVLACDSNSGAEPVCKSLEIVNLTGKEIYKKASPYKFPGSIDNFLYMGHKREGKTEMDLIFLNEFDTTSEVAEVVKIVTLTGGDKANRVKVVRN